MAHKRSYDGVVRGEATGNVRSLTIQLSAGDLATLLATDFHGMTPPHRQLYEALHNGVVQGSEDVMEEPFRKKIKQEDSQDGSFDIIIHYICRSAEVDVLEEHLETLGFKVYENNRIEDLFAKVEAAVPYSRFSSVSCLYKDDKCIYRPDTIDLEPDFGNTLKELGINKGTVLLFGPADDEVFENFEHENAAELHHDVIEAQQQVQELTDDAEYEEAAETFNNGTEQDHLHGNGVYEDGYMEGEEGIVGEIDEDYSAGDAVYQGEFQAGPYDLADPFAAEEAPVLYPQHTGLYQTEPAPILPVEYYEYPQTWP